MIKIEEIGKEQIPEIISLIHLTIRSCYPIIYPDKIIDFFLDYHCQESIEKRINEGIVLALKEDGILRATGFLVKEELGGVYVHPRYQRRGMGLKLVHHLLDIARQKNLSRVWLDATPLAKPLYDKMGFRLKSPMIQMIGNVPLDYYKMEILLGDG